MFRYEVQSRLDELAREPDGWFALQETGDGSFSVEDATGATATITAREHWVELTARRPPAMAARALAGLAGTGTLVQVEVVGGGEPGVVVTGRVYLDGFSMQALFLTVRDVLALAGPAPRVAREHRPPPVEPAAEASAPVSVEALAEDEVSAALEPLTEAEPSSEPGPQSETEPAFEPEPMVEAEPASELESLAEAAPPSEPLPEEELAPVMAEAPVGPPPMPDIEERSLQKTPALGIPRQRPPEFPAEAPAAEAPDEADMQPRVPATIRIPRGPGELRPPPAEPPSVPVMPAAADLVCRRCGATVQPGERFCINCGAPQPSAGEPGSGPAADAGQRAGAQAASSSSPALHRAGEPDTVLWRRPGGGVTACPRCGEQNPPENRHCQACGMALTSTAEESESGGRQAPVSGPRPCSRCGYSNPAGNRFCQGCGAPLAG